MSSVTLTFQWLKTFSSKKKSFLSHSPIFGTDVTKFYLKANETEPNLYSFDLIFTESKSKKTRICVTIACTGTILDRPDAVASKCYNNQVIYLGTPFCMVTLPEVQLYPKNKPNIPSRIDMKITFKEIQAQVAFDPWSSLSFCAGCESMASHVSAVCQAVAEVTDNSRLKTDYTLVTVEDGREFPVHSFILSMRSPVFAAMFATSDKKGSTGGVKKEEESSCSSLPLYKEIIEKKVLIEDVSGKVMEAMLAYVYCRDWKMVWNPDIICELALVADKYDIKPLFSACLAKLYDDEITEEDAAKRFYYAYIFELKSALTKIAKFILEHKSNVMKTNTWKVYLQSDVKLIEELMLHF